MKYPVFVDSTNIIDLSEVVQVSFLKKGIQLHFKRDNLSVRCKDNYALGVLRVLDAIGDSDVAFVSLWLKFRDSK